VPLLSMPAEGTCTAHDCDYVVVTQCISIIETSAHMLMLNLPLMAVSLPMKILHHSGGDPSSGMLSCMVVQRHIYLRHWVCVALALLELRSQVLLAAGMHGRIQLSFVRLKMSWSFP